MDATDPHLLAVGTALPGPAVDTAALARRFGLDALWEQWVDAFIGTRTRHLARNLDTGEVEHSLADLGATAARRALAAAGLSPTEVDLVVLATATPDELMPATVNLVADRLGLDGVTTFQLQSGCAGAVQALEVASRLLGSGAHRTALVLGGDVGARHFDLRVDVKSLPPAEVVNVVLFGDGAGAAVLDVEPAADSVALRTAFTRFTGLGRPPGQVIRWFGLADRDGAESAGGEDYKAIEELVPVLAAEILEELLDRLGWKPSDVDHLLPPQLSGRMTRRIVDGLGLPGAAEISRVGEIGNNGNALVFFQLERALAEMAPGQRAVGVAVESSKWVKAGFALEKPWS
ncbi:3-oxoacyl-ACP synthase III family protein [Actinosynnema sp. NPDC020468]|uniref:3-oxoacyl-ACP synthase III family protein n=1 Tax=Actinosynnema sp. NPDC020468 TaxID=3154488 RepID=UPI0033C4B741